MGTDARSVAARVGRLSRFCAWGLLWGGVLATPALAQGGAGTNPATLTIERNETCAYPNFTDSMRSIDTVPLMLPEGDGPVSGGGVYDHTGTGYAMSGPSTYRGRVDAGGDLLVLTFGQWAWQGKPLTPAAPEMPTTAQTVDIPLRQGGERLISFRNAHANLGSPCTGTVLYRLDLGP